MTTEIQIEGLALTLERDSPLSLVVRDQPMVAVFESHYTREGFAWTGFSAEQLQRYPPTLDKI
jgi:hypothetical protein